MATPDKSSNRLPADEAEVSIENLKKSGQWILLGVAGALLVVSIVQWRGRRQESLDLDVYQAYTEAYTIDALEQILAAFPERPEAPAARLQLGGMLFREGEFENALEAYDMFLLAHPRHPLREQARFGRAISLEELGRFDEAIEAYREFTGDDLLYPNALTGLARALERAGRTEESLPVYERIETEFADTFWAMQAEQFRRAAQVELR